jgi:hypothetical protein
MADGAKPGKLTLGEALKDLGWFPIALALLVGGPSVLAILESVLVDHELVPALQWIMDGYNRVMTLLGAVVEPLLVPAIAWLNALLRWTLTLDPVWRPLFALGMVFVLAFARAAWRDGDHGQAVAWLVGISIGALLGAVLAGLVPGKSDWWVQGLRAALPIFGLFALVGLTEAAIDIAQGHAGEAAKSLGAATGFALRFGLFAYALAAGLSFAPGLAAGAGVLAFGGLVALLGIIMVGIGMIGNNRFNTRLGLITLGGFVAAGLVLVADWALKALGAG